MENLIKERFDEKKSIWDPMTTRKLPTFASNVKAATVKIKDQLVQVKEEQKLISRFLIVYMTHHDTDLPSFWGNTNFQLSCDPYLLQMASFINQRTMQ